MHKSILIIFIAIACFLTINNTKKTVTKIIEINNSIEGKILAGYQGWFNAKGDGSCRSATRRWH